MTDERLRTVPEIAKQLHVSEKTIYRRIESGELPAIRVGATGPLRISNDGITRLLRPVRPDKDAA